MRKLKLILSLCVVILSTFGCGSDDSEPENPKADAEMWGRVADAVEQRLEELREQREPIQKIISEVTGHQIDALKPSTKTFHELGVDLYMLADIVITLEDELGIEVGDEILDSATNADGKLSTAYALNDLYDALFDQSE